MTNHRRPNLPRPGGFTLVELMISIALVLLLILGVNQVFLYTSQAVGAGEAVNAAIRDGRSVQTVLANDFQGLLPNGPNQTNAAFLSIHSTAVPAFLTANDQASSRNGDPLQVDINGNGTEGESTVPGEVISPATYNYRNHRIDTLGFFARGGFQRQTGNDNTFVADMSASDAFISYGHLWLPDASGTFTLPASDNDTPVTYPGAGTVATNPNNSFATQFVLGRTAMLLRQPDASSVISDSNGVSQAYVAASVSTAGTTGAAPTQYGFYTPLFKYTQYHKGTATVTGSVLTPSGTTATLSLLYQSRLDLGAGSIHAIEQSLSNYLNAALVNGDAGYNKWWYKLMGLPPDGSTPGVGTTLLTTNGPAARFQCNPFVPKPLTAAAAAQASPYFLKGCSQFTVEYAGDFLTQDNNVQYDRVGSEDPAYTAGGHNVYYGYVLSPGADGAIDYVLIPPADTTVPRSQWRKQIIWYGLPRNTSGQAGISGANGDVLPLRDWRKNAIFPPQSTAPISTEYAAFEKTLPTYRTNYASITSGMVKGETYTCVFGPNDPAPKLIRITITLVDPQGRLPEGQTYQYIFAVSPQ